MRTARFLWAASLFAAVGASGCGHTPTPEETKAQDDLHKIVSTYIVAQNHLGHPPASAAEVRDVFSDGSSGSDLHLLEDGRYVVVWKTPYGKDDKANAAAVLAFQKEAYTKGGMVQMMSGVDTPYMSADELKAALQKNPAWDPALLEAKPAKPADKP